jgi:hypothetical protein
MNEEELQQKVAAAKLNFLEQEDPTAKAYQHVFNALNKTTEYNLPSGFADELVNKVMVRQSEKSFLKDYLWLAAGILVLIISFGVTVYFTGLKFEWGFLKGISSYKGLFFFGIAFVVLLNWFDQRIVRNKQHTAQ